MSRKKTFLKGAFILTITGILSRCIGFFSRMFLSQIFGAEGMGLYQLIFPVYALCYALSISGIEVTISRCVSSKIARGLYDDAKNFIISSTLMALILSCSCTILLQIFADPISTYFLHESRTRDLLILLSYAFPFAAIHSCIVGYYLGVKQTGIPAISQLIEQLSRVLSIYLIYLWCIHHNITYSISIAVLGLVIGEISSTLFIIFYLKKKRFKLLTSYISIRKFIQNIKELLLLSTPLSANRVTLNMLTSIEAVSIPLKLQSFGLSSAEALSTYGVLIGMALPCLLFPTAFTSAISSMLLPTISEIQATNNKKEIKQIVIKTIQYGTLLGFTCLISFFLFSDLIGTFLFHNADVGNFIKVLAWICPFLYLNSNLLTIITALGKPYITFLLNACSLLLRIGCIYLFIPHFGIYGYLWGILASQIFITIGSIFTFKWIDII